MQQPEAYIGRAEKLFDPNGALTDDTTRALLQKFTHTFDRWIEVNRKR